MSTKKIAEWLIGNGWKTYEHQDPPGVPVYTLDNPLKPGWFWQWDEYSPGLWHLTLRNWTEHTDVAVSQMVLNRHVVEMTENLLAVVTTETGEE